MSRALLVIAGPTASGKSRLARAAAEAMDGVVINADSMQVYRELEILSARPGPEDMARAPHRLYGVLPAAEPCSAARWRDMATREIAAARKAGRLPILVGGTGLYLKALLEGLVPLPEIPPSVRARARTLHARLGGAAFHAELGRRDPEIAARLDPGDSQRLIRAFEVIEATGRSLAEWQREAGAGPALDLDYAAVVLRPPRAALYAACDQRFLAMVERGALAEVKALYELELDPELPAMKAVGVAELGRHLSGELTLDQAVALAQRSTRHYAKRQLTWFRHQLPGAEIFKAQYSECLRPKIFSFIRLFLLTANG